MPIKNKLLHTGFFSVAGTVVLGLLGTEVISAHDALTVASYGGAYTRSQMQAYIIPYTEKAETRFDVEDYPGGLKEVREQVNSYNVKWDLVDLEASDALRGCQEGLLEKIDVSILPPAPDGTPAKEDFIDGALQDCAVGEIVWSTIIAYNQDRFKDDRPQTIADFFNTDKFPGKRGLRKTPRANLEWALMADGVPADKVYEILSTPEGIDRAFRMLDNIKPFTVWWEVGTEPTQWLASGRVSMTTAYNGRMYDAIVEQGENFEIIWDGQILDINLWGIPKRTPLTADLEQILDFVKFATDTQRLADQAKYIAYGPARKSSMAYISEDIKPHLPTTDQNMKNAIRLDAQWWAENQEEMNKRFRDWLEKPAGEPLSREVM